MIDQYFGMIDQYFGMIDQYFVVIDQYFLVRSNTPCCDRWIDISCERAILDSSNLSFDAVVIPRGFEMVLMLF